jgi:hypothetical protein
MHARLLHEESSSNPRISSVNAAFTPIAAVTANIAFRPRSGDLILVNAGLAKLIPQVLVYSAAVIVADQMLAAARACLLDKTVRRWVTDWIFRRCATHNNILAGRILADQRKRASEGGICIFRRDGIAESLHIARDQGADGGIHDAVVGKPSRLDRGFGRGRTENDVAWRRSQRRL